MSGSGNTAYTGMSRSEREKSLRSYICNQWVIHRFQSSESAVCHSQSPPLQSSGQWLPYLLFPLGSGCIFMAFIRIPMTYRLNGQDPRPSRAEQLFMIPVEHSHGQHKLTALNDSLHCQTCANGVWSDVCIFGAKAKVIQVYDNDMSRLRIPSLSVSIIHAVCWAHPKVGKPNLTLQMFCMIV